MPQRADNKFLSHWISPGVNHNHKEMERNVAHAHFCLQQAVLKLGRPPTSVVEKGETVHTTLVAQELYIYVTFSLMVKEFNFGVLSSHTVDPDSFCKI